MNPQPSEYVRGRDDREKMEYDLACGFLDSVCHPGCFNESRILNSGRTS